jgi:hypothetical protein
VIEEGILCVCENNVRNYQLQTLQAERHVTVVWPKQGEQEGVGKKMNALTREEGG